MKIFFTLLLMIAVCSPTVCQADNDDGYMENHPSYNQNYYTPNYRSTPSAPNYDSNYYDRTDTQARGHSNQEDSTPYGNDIRDYNPYYDREGNLRQ